MIEECQGAGLVMDRDCYGNTVSANVVAHNGAGVDLRDAHGCSISANTFTIMKTDALRIGPASSRITVTGNAFSDSHIGDDTVKRRADDLAAAGLVLDATTDVVVTGNAFSGLKDQGVTLRGAASRRVVFSSNLIIDSHSDDRDLVESVVTGTIR